MDLAMDRDQLEAWLDQGLSLPQIGALVNRDPSTVGYWVQKYGLVANGNSKYAPRGGIARAELEPLVSSGATLHEIADALGRSEATVRYWIERHNLERPIDVRREQIEQLVRSGKRTIVRRCKQHGVTEFAIVGSDLRPRCKQCRADAVQRRRRKVKQILVEEAGGKCVLCGYHRCIAALEFHHRDPTQKSFGLAQRGITRALEKVREEAQKCILLCSNCHAEVGARFVDLPVHLKEVVSPK
jgi:5-methylcytosine-specific restriction endonuclease McrA